MISPPDDKDVTPSDASPPQPRRRGPSVVRLIARGVGRVFMPLSWEARLLRSGIILLLLAAAWAGSIWNVYDVPTAAPKAPWAARLAYVSTLASFRNLWILPSVAAATGAAFIFTWRALGVVIGSAGVLWGVGVYVARLVALRH